MSIFKPIGSNTYYPNYSNLGLVEFTHPTFGSDLAQDPGFSGTPEGLHNGTDTTLWTASNLVNTNWVFNSTAQARTGTQSIDGTNTINGDTMLLTKPSGSLNTDNFTVLDGWIYITDWNNPQNGTRDIFFQLRNNGTPVGQEVGLLSLIEPNNLNTWQEFQISLSSFILNGGEDFNEITIRASDTGAGAPPNFYLDDLALQESGGVITFASQIPQGFSLRLSQLSVCFARSGVWNESYDTVLGKTLSSGIIAQAWTPFGAFNLGVFRRHIDFMFPPGLRYFTGNDGVNSWVLYEYDFTVPVTLNGNLGGEFRALIQDDLSDFLYAQIGGRGELVETEKLGV